MAWVFCKQTATSERAQRVTLDQGGAFMGDGWVWCGAFARHKMAAALAGAGFAVDLAARRGRTKTKLKRDYQRQVLASMFR